MRTSGRHYVRVFVVAALLAPLLLAWSALFGAVSQDLNVMTVPTFTGSDPSSSDEGRDVQDWIQSVRHRAKGLLSQLRETPHAPAIGLSDSSIVHLAEAQKSRPSLLTGRSPSSMQSSSNASLVPSYRPTHSLGFWGRKRTAINSAQDGNSGALGMKHGGLTDSAALTRRAAIATAAVMDDDIGTASTIFVSMASFRDSHCEATLVDMFTKATVPSRVFVGLVEQGEPRGSPTHHAWHDAACRGRLLSAMCSVRLASGEPPFCPLDNIRTRRTTSKEAKGPTFGRFVAASMYQGETYFMMIDAHNKFIAGWDAVIIREYLQTVRLRDAAFQRQQQHRANGSRLPDAAGAATADVRGEPPAILHPHRVILSHYPAAYSSDLAMKRDGKEMYMRLMCSGHFLDNGIFRLDSDTVRALTAPIWQPLTAAGFLFADAALVAEVPFDPYLDFLFDGEEVLYSARAFTSGWDSYLPTVNILYHHYGRPHSPKVWSVPGNLWWVHQKVSMIRALVLLNQTSDAVKLERSDDPNVNQRIRAETDLYGMGRERSVAAFWRQAGVDPHTRKNLVAGGPHAYCQQLAHHALKKG